MALRTGESDIGGATPEMITLAREARGLTQSELAHRLGLSQGHLSKIEAGSLPASQEIVESLGRALDFPTSFFSQTDRLFGPSTSEFFHRKRAAVPVKIMDKIHAQLNIRRMQVSRLMRSADVPIQIPRLDPDEFNGDVEEIARAVRSMWQLPRGPVKDLVGAIEDAGGIVVRMRFDTNKVDAVSWWTPNDPPIFAINETLPADRERLTVAHELAHLIMHHVARPDMEAEANRFAAAFLMPAEDVRSHLREVSIQSLAALKPFWRVSMQALLKRADDLQLIPSGRVRWLWVQLSRAGYRTREPAELDFEKEKTSLMNELLDLHLNDLEFSPEQLADMFNVHIHDLQSSYGVGGPRRPSLRRVK